MEERKERKILGVIGGMGPEATSYYYENVIAHTRAEKDQDHINMVILSHASIPDRTESIISGDSAHLIRILTEDARTLEKMGAANIAIPCNTSHYYYEQIQKAVSVPVINMVRESVAYAVEKIADVKRIGIMATDGTINSRIYHKECRKLGITPVKPSPERQRDVMSLIYRVLSEFMRKGCDAVILACTELSVFKGKHEIPTLCLDAMDVLVRESIIRSGAQYQ